MTESMSPSVLPPPVWVDTPPGLEKLADRLVQVSRIAVDTESNSLHAFREQLCLVQFSIPQADFLVDPLVIKDLAPLAGIFSDPGIEKVFHAVEYDLVCLKRDFGICIHNLFDTMQAARILGYQRVGLDSMLHTKLGIILNKKFQKADWGKRPLGVEMLNYARLDTHHLLALRDCLAGELVETKRWELAKEEFIRLAEGNGREKPEQAAWQRVKGTRKFSARQLTLLQELCEWREAQARQFNRPPFKVIDDQRLIGVVLADARTPANLSSIGLTARQIQAYGSGILKAADRGRRAPLVTRPRAIRPSQAYLGRLNALAEWRKKAGDEIKLDSDIILPRAWMQHIAEQNPKNPAELAAWMPNSPWRLEKYGIEILKALAGK
jgi:ribonuclease D